MLVFVLLITIYLIPLQTVWLSNDYFPLVNQEAINCSDEEYTCSDGSCIQISQVCDFIVDCAHGEDEYCGNDLVNFITAAYN